MARTRTISPLFFEDEDVAELSLAARLCFAGLWTLADKAGRLEDRPRRIKNKLFGYDGDIDANELLDELAKSRNCSPGAFIDRYEVGGRKYIQINNFQKYQNPHPREQKSQIPPPGSEPPDSPPLKGEALVQSQWARQLNADREVGVEAGIIDLVTDKYAIEVKHIASWRDAMRQVLPNAADANRMPAVILYSHRETKETKVKSIRESLEKRGIEVIIGMPADYDKEQLKAIKNKYGNLKTKSSTPVPSVPSVPSIPSVSSVPSEKAALTSQRQPAQPAVRWEPAPKWQEDHESLGVTEFIVASEYFSQLVKDYPRLDVRAEIAKMKQYALANPSWARRKKNWRKTLTNWLNRADERFDDSRFKGGQARASPKEPKMYETLRRMKGEQIGDG